MSPNPQKPQKRYENNYVIDQENAAEMARLNHFDKLVTDCMGGVFVEHPDLFHVRRVLDVGSGPGGWASELAYAYPHLEVIGIDISQRMVRYALVQAEVQNIENVQFFLMDATQRLDFPDNSFDVVNGRFMGGFLNSQSWGPVVEELVRVASPGGMVRLTETDSFGVSTSYALERYSRLIARANHLSGRSFVPYQNGTTLLGLTPMLDAFLRMAGCQKRQLKSHVLDFSAGTVGNLRQYENYKVAMKLMQPYIMKMGVATQEEVDDIYDRLMVEMLSDDFRGLWYFLSAYGYKPE